MPRIGNQNPNQDPLQQPRPFSSPLRLGLLQRKAPATAPQAPQPGAVQPGVGARPGGPQHAVTQPGAPSGGGGSWQQPGAGQRQQGQFYQPGSEWSTQQRQPDAQAAPNNTATLAPYQVQNYVYPNQPAPSGNNLQGVQGPHQQAPGTGTTVSRLGAVGGNPTGNNPPGVTGPPPGSGPVAPTSLADANGNPLDPNGGSGVNWHEADSRRGPQGQGQNSEQDYRRRYNSDNAAGSEFDDFAAFLADNGLDVYPDGRITSGGQDTGARIGDPTTYSNILGVYNAYRKMVADRDAEKLRAENQAYINGQPTPQLDRAAMDRSNTAIRGGIDQQRGLAVQRAAQQGSRAGVGVNSQMGMQADIGSRYGMQQNQLIANNELEFYSQQYKAELMAWQDRAGRAEEIWRSARDQQTRDEAFAQMQIAAQRSEEAQRRLMQLASDLDEPNALDWLATGAGLFTDFAKNVPGAGGL